MEKVIISPTKYVQGSDVMCNIAQYTENLGSNLLFIAGNSAIKIISESVKKSYESTKTTYDFEKFNGECSKNEVNRLIDICKTKKIDCIIAAGGGKVLDTGKAVAYYLNLPVVVIPTIASTDAPCSALSVLYTDHGVFDQYLFLKSNPQVVLVDTKIIAHAPERLLVAGIGDALATYYEARACSQSQAKTIAGGRQTNASMVLAELCLNILLEDGLKAKYSAENKTVTKSLENIVEANTYLSGIGFESGGLAAAHSIHNGLTIIEELHNLYHGEKVAFGTLVQLVLEQAPTEELHELIIFCKSLGLPTNFKELGLKNVNKELLYKAAQLACVEGETIHNMPFEVLADDVYASMLLLDSISSNM